jgi:hypothetical protein
MPAKQFTFAGPNDPLPVVHDLIAYPARRPLGDYPTKVSGLLARFEPRANQELKNISYADFQRT